MTDTTRLSGTPLKIVHVITGLGAGGAERQLATLVLNSDPALVRHAVIALRDEGVWGAKLREAGVVVHALGLGNKLGAALHVPRLARLIRQSGADLVQTWLYHADLFGLMAAKMARKPVIWTLRSSYLPPEVAGWQTRALVKLLTALSGWPDAVVANAEAGKAWHQSAGYHPRHWAVISNGIDCAQFHPDPEAHAQFRRDHGLPPDALVMGNLSRHDPWKDHPTLLAALAQVKAPVRLLLVGDGIEVGSAALEQQIAAAGVDPARLIRLGRRSDVAWLHAAQDLAVLSSISEGFPNVIAEAMACGVPVVGTAVGDTPLIVGDCGETVPPRDPAALAAAIDRFFAQDVIARAAMGQRARTRIEMQFSVPTMVAAYRRLYEDVLTRRVGSRN